MSTVPGNPSKAGLSYANRFLLSMVERLPVGTITVEMPDGRRFRFEKPTCEPAAEIKLTSNRAARKLLLNGHVGFAESYLDGDWETPDLTKVIELGSATQAALGQSAILGGPLFQIVNRLMHLLKPNTRKGASKNIQAHYDLGNDFYQQWLDPSMTYSSGIYTDPTTDLETAQRRKYARIAEIMGLAPDHHVLEIGCGWGGFAEFAAKTYGCRVTGITISPAQLSFARERIQKAGLADRVDLQLIDYRDVTGTFDRIASIEMIEAVGEAYWPSYFSAIRDRLKPGGMAALQAITISDRLFPRYRKSADFIQRYVFPGGMLPSPTVLQDLVARHGLSFVADDGFRLDYARTLKTWLHRFEQAWPQIQKMGYDERFRRLWQYYLCYCEGGFLTGDIDVRQIALKRL